MIPGIIHSCRNNLLHLGSQYLRNSVIPGNIYSHRNNILQLGGKLQVSGALCT